MHSYSQLMIIDTFSIAFLISLYGAPLAQRASYLAQHSSLFGPDGAVNYVTSSINSLLIGSKGIPNGACTNHCWANLAHASKLIKNSDSVYQTYNFRQELTTAENIFISFLKTINKLLQN